MGNTVPPSMCRGEATGAPAAPARRWRPKKVAAAEPSRRAVLVAPPRGKQRDGGEDDEPEGAAAARHQPWSVSPSPPRAAARGGGGSGAEKESAPAAGAVPVATTVRIVMRRKDAEALVARLHARAACGRKARMAELKGELRRVGGGGASPAPCHQDAWKPRLAPIQEN